MERHAPTPHHARRGHAVLLLAATTTLAAGCSDSSAPKQPSPTLTIVAGAGVTDTVQTAPLQSLVVEVHQPDGSPAQGAIVRFVPQCVPDPTYETQPPVCAKSATDSTYTGSTSVQTNASGRATALLRMGVRAGRAGIAIKVAALGLQDTAWYTVAPGNATTIVMSIRDTVVYPGARYTIGATTADRFGNVRHGDAFTYAAASSNISVSDGGVVTANAEGGASVVVQSGSVVDTALIGVAPHGTIVYVGSPGGVSIINLDQSGHRFLHAVSDWSVFPQWAPDGKWVILYEGDPNTSARLTLTGIDSTTRSLFETPREQLMGMGWPRFAPDGTIYFGGVTGGVGTEVWQVHADGTGLVQIPNSLGNGQYEHPVVSPDGRTLLFDNARSTGGLMALDLASGTTTALGNGMWPSYSPDGTMIAYFDAGRVMVADASGANARAIAPPGTSIQELSAPSWTADSKWVFVPGSPSTLVRVSDGNLIPLPFTLGFVQPSLR